MMRKLLSLIALLIGALSLAAPAVAAEGPLVLAAASLQESLNAAADRWAALGHPRPVLAFAASSALARQAASGAPADLFISADEQWMDYLGQAGALRPGTRTVLVTNALVLIAPAEGPGPTTFASRLPLARRLGAGPIAMADPSAVPAGIYGKQALTSLGVWDEFKGRVVAAENVRAAMALVARREARLGVVYATDALADRRVRIVYRFPDTSHAPIVYPVAVLKASRHPDVERFRQFLLGAEGKAIFARFGFGVR